MEGNAVSPSKMWPRVCVEYDTTRGRERKYFDSPYDARRFYAMKLKNGKRPAVRRPHSQG